MTADLVTDALIMGIWRRQPDPELLHHSDQGRQYTCEQTQKLLADHGIECSKSVLSGEIDTFLKSPEGDLRIPICIPVRRFQVKADRNRSRGSTQTRRMMRYRIK